jgi:hypothetical protein
MKQIDIDRVRRFHRAFPELKFVYTPEQIIAQLDAQKKEKKEIDKYFENYK